MHGVEKKDTTRSRSTTSEILGTANGAEIPSRWAVYFQALSDLRERLTGERSQQSIEARQEQPYFSEHMADAGSDSYDRDWALAMASSTQSVLYEVDQAINRIRNGTYGICEMTGRKIEPARLRAVPWTRFGAAAQAELEAGGSLRRMQLAPLEPLVSTSGETEDKEETILEAA